MTIALIVLHAGPHSTNPRADTAVRLAGAMLADNKEVRMFLAGEGVLLLKQPPDLLLELLALGLEVQCCGSSLQAQGMKQLPDGVQKSSMKGLSSWMTEADEVLSF
ncbi:DsrE family protein [Acidithiobacillus sp. IBUN Pt1247-S3]|uniref:DsrE family protein n=1 Tax=Acidithiobacillus sp. IBUN Pt1247-S3 TaxID=3166642 RepID=UPI0034E4332E